MDIFISYRRNYSSAIAGRICDRLRAKFGDEKIFMDVDSIDPGSRYDNFLREKIKTSKIMLVIISKNWATIKVKGEKRLFDQNDYVRMELEEAITNGITVIPILVEGAKRPNTDDLPDSLKDVIKFQEVTVDNPSFDADVNKLNKFLEKTLSKITQVETEEKRQKVTKNLKSLASSSIPEIVRGATSSSEQNLNRSLNQILEDKHEWHDYINICRWLRGARRTRQLALFSERLIRKDPPSSAIRVWLFHGLALVELGLLTTAENFLAEVEPMVAGMEEQYSSTIIDIIALRGRIAKQRYFDLPIEIRAHREDLLAESAGHYQRAAERADPMRGLRYLPAINVLSLIVTAKTRNFDLKIKGDRNYWANLVVNDLAIVEANERTMNPGWNAAMAECQLALGNVEGFCKSIEELINQKLTEDEYRRAIKMWNAALPYVEIAPIISGFRTDQLMLTSVIRQFTEVWNIKQHADPRVREFALNLELALLKREGGSIEITPENVRISDQFEGVLGDSDKPPIQWILAGMNSAKSVAAVIKQSYSIWEQVGTAFCIAIKGNEGYYALTNAHVVSDREPQTDGFPVATSAHEIRLRFDAIEGSPECEVEKIVWTSPMDGHDATLLLLKTMPAEAMPLRPTRKIPHIDQSRLYAISYQRRDIPSLFIQDNELLDHQGLRVPPPTPPNPVLVHYRGLTESGKPGGPVFDDNHWSVVALHCKAKDQSEGGPGLTLSGRRRYPRANEGISMESISWALKSEGIELDFTE